MSFIDGILFPIDLCRRMATSHSNKESKNSADHHSDHRFRSCLGRRGDAFVRGNLRHNAVLVLQAMFYSRHTSQTPPVSRVQSAERATTLRLLPMLGQNHEHGIYVFFR